MGEKAHYVIVTKIKSDNNVVPTVIALRIILEINTYEAEAPQKKSQSIFFDTLAEIN